MSSEFDAKEQLARNLLGSLGPFSQPEAVLELGAGPGIGAGLNASLLWLDPVGWLADITEVHIEENPQVNLFASNSIKVVHLIQIYQQH